MNNLEDTVLSSKLFCEYVEKCNKGCFKDKEEYTNCQIRKFYDKYGTNNEMFIGSKK